MRDELSKSNVLVCDNLSHSEERYIDPKQLPDYVFEQACFVLASSIRLALSDPEKRADFERWKREREEKAKTPCVSYSDCSRNNPRRA